MRKPKSTTPLGHIRKHSDPHQPPAGPKPGSKSFSVLTLVATNLLALGLGLLGSTYGPRILANLEHGLNAGPLIVSTGQPPWPFLECSDDPPVAMLDSRLSVHAFGGDDPRPEMIDAGGAAWNQGHLTISAFTPDSTPVYIYDLKIVVFKHVATTKPAWIRSWAGGGCGGGVTRIFSADIDAPHDSNKVTVIDRGVEDDMSDDVTDKPKVNSSTLGPNFTASIADPARFRLDVTSCTGYTEWGLLIDYNHGGTDFEKEIGSPGSPFRIVGVTSPIPTYIDGGSQPQESVARADHDLSCTPRFRTDSAIQPRQTAKPCTNGDLAAAADSPIMSDTVVDELSCRGRFALQHLDAEVIERSEYRVFVRQGSDWTAVLNAGMDANGIDASALSEAGVNVLDFEHTYADCISQVVKDEILLKQCR